MQADGCTPLFVACATGSLACVKLLLEAGANIEEAEQVGPCRMEMQFTVSVILGQWLGRAAAQPVS